jgi:hypothetical protein
LYRLTAHRMVVLGERNIVYILRDRWIKMVCVREIYKQIKGECTERVSVFVCVCVRERERV